MELTVGDALELAHRALSHIELADDVAADVEQLGTRWREVDLLAELLEQWQPGVVCELPDLRRDGRLRQVHPSSTPNSSFVAFWGA